MCVYKLTNGRFREQYGKNSEITKKQEKDRHIPPFPFKNVVSFNRGASKDEDDLMVLRSGDNQGLSIYSQKTRQLLVQLQKKGDFNLSCFDALGDYLIYSDSFETQVFKVEAKSLTIVKLTQKLCLANQLEHLGPVDYVKFTRRQSGELKAILIDQASDVLILDLESLKLEKAGNLSSLVSESADKGGRSKFRRYDQIVSLVSWIEDLTMLAV